MNYLKEIKKENVTEARRNFFSLLDQLDKNPELRIVISRRPNKSYVLYKSEKVGDVVRERAVDLDSIAGKFKVKRFIPNDTTIAHKMQALNYVKNHP